MPSIELIILIGVIILVPLAILGIIVGVSRNWVRVAPYQVAVIYGRKHKVDVVDTAPGTTAQVTRKVERGFRLSKGGGFFKIPILEKVEYLPLGVVQIQVKVEDIPDSNMIPITVAGVANIKFSSDEDMLASSIESFLEQITSSAKDRGTVSRRRGRDEEYIPDSQSSILGGVTQTVKENLEGNMRSIIGQETVDGLIKGRDKFQQKVREEVVDDLAKLGIELKIFNIQSISDSEDYIKNLGAAEAARVKMEAAIAVAQAERETMEKTAEATRAGKVALAESDRAISDAERQRDEAIAQNDALVKAEQARIEMRAQQAAAEEQAELNRKTVEAEDADAKARIQLMDSVRQKNEAEQEATTIVTARKVAEAEVIRAEGEAAAAEKIGEALRIKAAKEGEGNRDKMSAEAEGRIKQADATEREKKADAAGAEAMHLADAAGIREKGLAEAETTEKKAEAYTHLDQSGKVMIILESLPVIAEALGEAVAASVRPASEAIGAGMASIGNVDIIDMGGANEDGKNVLTQFATAPIQTVFGLSKKFEATAKLSPLMGVMAKAVGIDVDALTKVVAKAESSSDPDFLAATTDLIGKVKGSAFEPVIRSWMEDQGMDPDAVLGALEADLAEASGLEEVAEDMAEVSEVETSKNAETGGSSEPGHKKGEVSS